MKTILSLIAFVLLIVGEVSCGAAVHPDQCNINPILSANLQSFGVPGGTQHGAQVKNT